MQYTLDDDDQVTFHPIEAPPCGARLDLNARDVHIVCDRIAGHQDEDRDDWSKHRAVIDAAAGYALHWCEDDCAHRCDHELANNMAKIYEGIQRGPR